MTLAMTHLTSVLITIVPMLSTVVGASRILAVFPQPTYSQQMVFKSLTTELARRGHELTVFTTNPANDSSLPSQYTEVNLNHFHDFSTRKINFYAKVKLGVWSFLQDIYNYNENITDGTLSHPVMQRLISPNSTAKFDLIIVHCFIFDGLYALSVRFNAPLIVISPLSLLCYHNLAIGNPMLPVVLPDILTEFEENMSLWQRFVNLYCQLRQIFDYKYTILPIQEKIIRKHFGDSVPPADQLISRVSLFLVNTHPFFGYSRPNIPAIVHVGGFHLKSQKKKLPQDLKKILDGAKEGCIYFSLGTNVKSNHLPIERLNIFLKVFARLPYKVLWKFESDNLANKPDNVVIRKWLPQQEVLAHPNIRLFISQGGLHSTDEAIANAVPMISLPISADQIFNTRRLQFFGGGKYLNIIDMNEEEFEQAVLEVMTNSSYKENMLKLRDLLRDLPYKPMDNAIWWIEHVIRHKGASHLRYRAKDMPWYQEQMLDLMAIALGAIALVIYIIVAIIRYVLNRQCLARPKTKHESKKDK